MIRLALCACVLFDQFDSKGYTYLEPLAPLSSIKAVKAFMSLCAVMFCISLFSLLVFLRYQIYYGYPLETYLEYPIVIAQGNFCKLCFGNEMGLIQPSKPLHVGTAFHCSDAGVGGKRELTSHIKLSYFKCH